VSIEQTLERIAVALERIAGSAHSAPAAPAEAPVVEEPKKPRAKKETPAPEPVDEVPGIAADDTPAGPPMDDNDGAGETPGVRTGAELRALAQKYIDVAGPQTNALVTFCRSVAAIFNPQEPKLIKVPDAKAAEAAAMLDNWCKKNKIRAKVEV